MSSAMFLRTAMVLYSAVVFGGSAIAPPLLQFDIHNTLDKTFQVFPVSSEIQIGKLYAILANAPPGMYLTVGSERGFRAASMMPKITYLWLLDVSDIIVRYNLINRELLKAPTRQDYLHLRWDATLAQWQSTTQSTVLSAQDFAWWNSHVRDLKQAEYSLPEFLNRNHKSPPCKDKKITSVERSVNLGTIIDYKTGNYLFDDLLYQRLHQLAIDQKILVSQANLKDPQQVAAIADYLKTQRLEIGVLDLDNLYYKDYLGQVAYRKLVQALLPLGQKNTLLLIMSNYKNYACGQYQFYFGFSFANVATWQTQFKMQDFIDAFPKEIPDIINGKLFEKDDLLPCFKNACLTTAGP